MTDEPPLFPCRNRQDRADQLRWTRARRHRKREIERMMANGRAIAAGQLRIVPRVVRPVEDPQPVSPMARFHERPNSARHNANWSTLVECGYVVVETMADRTAMFDRARKHRAKVTSKKRLEGGWTVSMVVWGDVVG